MQEPADKFLTVWTLCQFRRRPRSEHILAFLATINDCKKYEPESRRARAGWRIQWYNTPIAEPECWEFDTGQQHTLHNTISYSPRMAPDVQTPAQLSFWLFLLLSNETRSGRKNRLLGPAGGVQLYSCTAATVQSYDVNQLSLVREFSAAGPRNPLIVHLVKLLQKLGMKTTDQPKCKHGSQWQWGSWIWIVSMN